jgi:hypothetical protein
MEPIVIEPTEHSAKVNFNISGQLLLEGRSLPENVAEFYNPLVDFVNNLEADAVTFNVNLDYFNTATSKKLLELMKHLDDNNKIGSVLVNWHFEDGDDESVEMAEIYEEKCPIRTKFRYIEHAETVELFERVKLAN